MQYTKFLVVSADEERMPFVLKSIGTDYAQDSVERASGQNAWQYLHCSRGEGIFVYEGKSFEIAENQGFFFAPDKPHQYYPVTGTWETCWFTFSGTAASEFMRYLNIPDVYVFSITDRAAVDKYFQTMIESVSSPEALRTANSSVALYQFLTRFRTLVSDYGVQIRKGISQRLGDVLSYIERHYAEDITLDQMARQVDITQQHLCRIFKKEFGMSPFAYLIRYRIQIAKELLLAHPDMPIKEISTGVGFHDTSYFCASFKEHENMTPMTFRKTH